MSRTRDIARRVAHGTGAADLRDSRRRVAHLEEAVVENARLNELLATELDRLEATVADVAEAFLGAVRPS